MGLVLQLIFNFNSSDFINDMVLDLHLINIYLTITAIHCFTYKLNLMTLYKRYKIYPVDTIKVFPNKQNTQSISFPPPFPNTNNDDQSTLLEKPNFHIHISYANFVLNKLHNIVYCCILYKL